MNSHGEIVLMAVPITAILGLVGLLIILRKFDNDEKMAMIEKGLALPQKQGTKVNPASALRWGCLFVGVGSGIFIANLLEGFVKNVEPLYPALIMICGGLGLLVSYYVQFKLDQKEK